MSAGRMKSGGVSLDTYAKAKKAKTDKIVGIIDKAGKSTPATRAKAKTTVGRERSQRRTP